MLVLFLAKVAAQRVKLCAQGVVKLGTTASCWLEEAPSCWDPTCSNQSPSCGALSSQDTFPTCVEFAECDVVQQEPPPVEVAVPQAVRVGSQQAVLDPGSKLHERRRVSSFKQNKITHVAALPMLSCTLQGRCTPAVSHQVEGK